MGSRSGRSEVARGADAGHSYAPGRRHDFEVAPDTGRHHGSEVVLGASMRHDPRRCSARTGATVPRWRSAWALAATAHRVGTVPTPSGIRLSGWQLTRRSDELKEV